jgi:hypothetical protein
MRGGWPAQTYFRKSFVFKNIIINILKFYVQRNVFLDLWRFLYEGLYQNISRGRSAYFDSAEMARTERGSAGDRVEILPVLDPSISLRASEFRNYLIMNPTSLQYA